MGLKKEKESFTLEIKGDKYMKEIGKTIKWKAMEYSNGLMEIFMKVNLSRTCFPDMELKEVLMDHDLRGIGNKTRFMD